MDSQQRERTNDDTRERQQRHNGHKRHRGGSDTHADRGIYRILPHPTIIAAVAMLVGACFGFASQVGANVLARKPALA